MANSIHNLKTDWYENETGEFPAIVMGLNINDLQSVDLFLDDVVQEFIYERMRSPPDTANMTVTIAGVMTADTFRSA